MEIEEFQLIYELIVFVVFCFSFELTKKSSQFKWILCSIFVLALTILIGTRPMNIGTDTGNYRVIFDLSRYTTLDDIKENLSEVGSDPLFNIILIVGHIIGSYTSVLVIISFLTLFFGYRFCKRLSDYLGVNNSIALFCCYLISFYIVNQQVNIIRAGLAAVLLLNYYLSVFQSDRKSAIWYGVLAIGIHFSSIFGILLPLVAKYIKFSKKIYLIGFFVAVFLAYLNFGVLNISFFAGMDLGSKNQYLTSESDVYITGFRGTFALFNTFFAILFYKYIRLQNDFIQPFFRLYILFSILFFMCFQIPYSDRIGAFSWNLIPFMTYLCALQVFKFKQNNAMVFTFVCLFIIQFGIRIFA